MDTIERHKEAVRTYIRALGTGDVDEFASVLTDDFVAIICGRSVISGPMSREDVLAFIKQVPTISPDGCNLEILSLSAEDDRVACESEGHIVLSNGAEYNNMYIHLFRFRDGKIREVKEYMDTELAVNVYLPVMGAAMEA